MLLDILNDKKLTSDSVKRQAAQQVINNVFGTVSQSMEDFEKFSNNCFVK